MLPENDSTKQLLEQNQQLLESLDKRLHKIERKFKWDTILGIIKWVIIVAPIVLGIIWISPYVKQYAVYLEPAIKLLHLDELQVLNQQNVDISDEQQILNTLCDPNKREVLVNQICK